MFDDQGAPQYDVIKANIAAMLQAIQSGAMPKGAPNSLSTAETDTLQSWHGAGDLNN